MPTDVLSPGDPLDPPSVSWSSTGLTIDLLARDPRAPRPDLTPLVGFLGTPILLVFTVFGIHMGAAGTSASTQVLATLGGACGLMLGQALVYGVAVLVDEWARQRDCCHLEVSPQRIRVRRGRTVLLDAPPGQVTSWDDGHAIELVGLGDHVQLFTTHDAGLARWLVARVREARSQARAMLRPKVSSVRALNQVLQRVDA